MPNHSKKLSEEELLEVTKMASCGLTQIEIAVIKGMDVKTLRKHALDAYLRGAALVVYELKQAAIVAAKNGDPQMLRFALTNLSDWTTTTKTELSGPNGSPIMLSNASLSDEELEKKLRDKAKRLGLLDEPLTLEA